MTVALVKKIRTSQPQINIDTADNDLIYFLNCAAFNDIILGANGSIAVDGEYTAIKGSGNAVGYAPLDLSAYKQLTVTGLVSASSWSSGSYEMFWEFTSDGNSTPGGFALYLDIAGNKITLGQNSGSGATGFFAFGSYLPAINKYAVFTAVYDLVNTTQSLYINGIKIPLTGIITTVGTGSFANSQLNLLCRNQASFGLPGNLAAFFIHKGVLSDARIQQIANNPWQIFKPKKTIFSFSSASNNLSPSWNEQPESLSATINASSTAAVSWTESAETLSAIINASDQSTIMWIESQEILSTNITQLNTISAAWAESAEILSVNIAQLNYLSLSWTETPEVFSSSIGVSDKANLSWYEFAETFSESISVGVIFSGYQIPSGIYIMTDISPVYAMTDVSTIYNLIGLTDVN